MKDTERAHIYKVGDDEPDHEMLPTCWCNTVMTYKDVDGEVWTHRERKELEQ